MNKQFKSIGKWRIWIRLMVAILLAGSLGAYLLYIAGRMDFRFLGIADFNPYGGWSALRGAVTDGDYKFTGISRSMALTAAIATCAIIGGRFFCGWICPLGSLQDVFADIGNRVGILHRKTALDRHLHPWRIKYVILFVVLGFSALGYGAVLADFSPWQALLTLPSRATQKFLWDISVAGLWILIGIAVTSVFVSRPFCRYFCPLGAAQALLSSFNPININYAASCGGCNARVEPISCSVLSDCPVELTCEDGEDSVSPECIRCLRCATHDSEKTDNPSANCAAAKLNIQIWNRTISAEKYCRIMLALFLITWLALPLLGQAEAHRSQFDGEMDENGIYYGEGTGFGGSISTEVSLKDGKIEKISILDHNETRGWYEEAFRKMPEQMLEIQGPDADGISGATATSYGLIDSVQDALSHALTEEN